MNERNNDRENRKKTLIDAMDNPYLLLTAQEYKFEGTPTGQIFRTESNDVGILLSVMEEESIRDMIDLFNKALAMKLKNCNAH